MFILTKIQDLVQIDPRDQHEKESLQALEDEINSKYANKVIQKIGLCICLYDLLEVSDGQIGAGSGLVSVNISFRLIVFRPFKQEVMVGRISASNAEGIKLRTHFFDEIWVPQKYLPEGSVFEHEHNCWVWHFEDNDLYFDNQEAVRFRIEEENWFDQQPTKPEMEDESDAGKTSPYQILASMEDAGLGPCLWWDGGEEEGEEGEEAS